MSVIKVHSPYYPDVVKFFYFHDEVVLKPYPSIEECTTYATITIQYFQEIESGRVLVLYKGCMREGKHPEAPPPFVDSINLPDNAMYESHEAAGLGVLDTFGMR